MATKKRDYHTSIFTGKGGMGLAPLYIGNAACTAYQRRHRRLFTFYLEVGVKC